jgi:PhnB protein
MRMNPYLSFKGDCEAAFTFYEHHLDAQRGSLFRYGGSPMSGDVPPDWSDKIMHGTVTVGGQVLMGGDVAPERYEAPKGFSLSLQIDRTSEAERVFHALSEGGTIVMPLERTFWAARFGMIVDRFGIPWLINCEASEPSDPSNPTD